jgi:hypothetical protein
MCIFERICFSSKSDDSHFTNVWGLNPSGVDIFPTHPDWPRGPPSLLYSGYRVSFPGVKQVGRSVNHPPAPSAKVQECIDNSTPYLGLRGLLQKRTTLFIPLPFVSSIKLAVHQHCVHFISDCMRLLSSV